MPLDGEPVTVANTSSREERAALFAENLRLSAEVERWKSESLRLLDSLTALVKSHGEAWDRVAELEEMLKPAAK